MLTSVKRIAVLALLFLLPLQALAAAVAPVMCLGSGDHHHAMHATDDGHHHHAHGDQHSKPDNSGTSDVSAHLDCHHLFSGAPVNLPSLTTPDLPVLQATVSSAATPYIPELPQRPPRR